MGRREPNQKSRYLGVLLFPELFFVSHPSSQLRKSKECEGNPSLLFLPVSSILSLSLFQSIKSFTASCRSGVGGTIDSEKDLVHSQVMSVVEFSIEVQNGGVLSIIFSLLNLPKKRLGQKFIGFAPFNVKASLCAWYRLVYPESATAISSSWYRLCESLCS